VRNEAEVSLSGSPGDDLLETDGVDTFIVAYRNQGELSSNLNALLFFSKCQFRSVSE
jgi:hypothetical protein